MNYNLQRLLVIIGLIAIPFYELFFKVFPFVRVIAPDTREPKELIALTFALAIGLLAVFQGTLKPFRNKYFLILVVFLLLNLFMSPQADLFINNVQVGDMFFWKPFAKVLCFALLMFAVASMDIDFNDILKTMAYCSFAMSIYVILQRLGFDQFWIQREGEQYLWVSGRAFGGNLGQPTLAASFIATIIPIAFYLRKYIFGIVMFTAVVLTKSEMALIALAIVFVFYIAKSQRLLFPIIIFFILFFVIGCSLFSTNYKVRSFINDHSSGRTSVWRETFNDIKDGAISDGKQDFSFTGVGFGRFAFIFPDKHKSNFQQTHNDILEFTYNCGLIGSGILIVGLFFMVKSAWYCNDSLPIAILLSFLTILIISFGSFPFQLGAHQFYSAVLIGLLHNNSIIRRMT